MWHKQNASLNGFDLSINRQEFGFELNQVGGWHHLHPTVGPSKSAALSVVDETQAFSLPPFFTTLLSHLPYDQCEFFQ